MKTILVTGARGFLGTNLCVALRRRSDCEVLEFTRSNAVEELPKLVARADVVFHLAGVNRPKEESEFTQGNAQLTRLVCEALEQSSRRPLLVLSSSIQAELNNPYGQSKKAAEDAVTAYAQRTGAPVRIFRFPNVFGKWSRPNYNTVVATYCHNLSRGLPVQVNNRAAPLRFVYVDDIVREFLKIVDHAGQPAPIIQEVQPVHSVTLGELHDLIASFQANREQSILPDLSDPLIKALYSTYVSFLDVQNLAYPVALKTDERGWLFELAKSPYAGQIFVSRTKPGITRGNHYHDSKIEKFCVIQGEGVIRFRHVLGEQIVEYPVNDREIRIVDIVPGYTHSIENVGESDMITLFWANEIFDPQRPDTFFVKVKPDVANATR